MIRQVNVSCPPSTRLNIREGGYDRRLNWMGPFDTPYHHSRSELGPDYMSRAGRAASVCRDDFQAVMRRASPIDRLMSDAMNRGKPKRAWFCSLIGLQCNEHNRSLRSWRDFVRERFCFGSEAVNASGEAVRALVKSRVEFPPAQISGVFWIMRSPVHANFGLAESTETSIKC